jgi:hypothetical protein
MCCARRFEDLLRALTMARPDICDAMVFALDNAECAGEVRRALELMLYPSSPPSCLPK